jgi:hypothetical protein
MTKKYKQKTRNTRKRGGSTTHSTKKVVFNQTPNPNGFTGMNPRKQSYTSKKPSRNQTHTATRQRSLHVRYTLIANKVFSILGESEKIHPQLVDVNTYIDFLKRKITHRELSRQDVTWWKAGSRGDIIDWLYGHKIPLPFQPLH